MTPRLWLSCLCALLASAPSTAAGSCQPDDPENCTTRVKAGDPAPYGGWLLTPRAAAIMAVNIETGAKVCDLRVQEQLRLCQVDLGLSGYRLRTAKDDTAATLQACETAIDGTASAPWYWHPAVVAPATLVLTLLFHSAFRL